MMSATIDRGRATVGDRVVIGLICGPIAVVMGWALCWCLGWIGWVVIVGAFYPPLAPPWEGGGLMDGGAVSSCAGGICGCDLCAVRIGHGVGGDGG